MRYEVYIPAMDRTGANLTLMVEAENWMLALRQGLAEIGVDRRVIAKSYCEIRSDQSVRVTDPVNGHVFIVRQVTEACSKERPALPDVEAKRPERPERVMVSGEAGAGQDLPGPGGTPAAPRVPARMPRTAPDPAPVLPSVIVDGHPAGAEGLPASGGGVPGPAAAVVAPAGKVPETPKHRTSPEIRRADEEPMSPRSARRTRPDLARLNVETHYTMPAAAGTPPRPDTQPAVRVRRPSPPQQETTRQADTARQIPRPVPSSPRAQAALGEVLARVPARTGWVLRLQPGEREFSVVAAAGVASDLVLGRVVAVEAEVAGMCLLGGVTMALTSGGAGEGFRSRLAERVGLAVESVLCAPILERGRPGLRPPDIDEGGRAVGALQLMNREGGGGFTRSEVGDVTAMVESLAEELRA